LVYFSIYLDKLGWESNGFSLEDNLLLTALAVKMYLNENFKFIVEFLSRTKTNYLQQLNRWLETKKDYNVLSIAARDINMRFNQLIKPSNPFCKNNFIDFNFVVDQILQMSIPYNDTKTHNSGHHTELSKFSFQNDNFVAKNANVQNSAFSNSQNSMFSKFIPSNIFLNQPKNLSPNSQENIINAIQENAIHYNSLKKNEDKNANYPNNDNIDSGAKNEISRIGSGFFGNKNDSDNLIPFIHNYSALNFQFSRESSNNLYAAQDDEKLPDNFFKNKQPSNNQFQNLIAYKSEDYLEKNVDNQEKPDIDKQNQTQLKLSVPVNNTDNANLYNKWKTIKNGTFENSLGKDSQ